MARRPAYLRETDPVPKAIERHIEALGFVSSQVYFDWCWANGFDGSFEKSRSDLQEEAAAFEQTKRKREKHARLHKNPKAFLEAVCTGELSSDEIERPIFKQIALEIEASNELATVRKSLLDMLQTLSKFENLVFETITVREDVPLVRGLIKLHDRKALWLRPLEGWKPNSKNGERRFGELAHHLFDQYGDVPQFMESVWLRNDRPSWRYRDWFVHLGRGYNLRKAKSPVPLTKKMAHYFLQAPNDFTAEQAIRWGQLKALGSQENAINSTIATRIGQSFVNEDFWFSVLRFIADNPMLDPRQIGPIVDYLHYQKFEMNEIEIAPGQWRHEPPPQPGLSMNGRTVPTLLRQVDEWHRSFGRLREFPEGEYEKADFDGVTIEKGSHEKSVRWVIRQLRNARDLHSESEDLRHCVSSYHGSCARGNCTIWNLSVCVNNGTYERRQTIEVDRHGVIVQCRGFANQDPTTEEWAIVNRWAGDAGLLIANYL